MPGPRSKYLKNAAAPYRARTIGRAERAIPGYAGKSRRYLRLAVENEQRAARTENAKLKATFLKIAAQYRDLALQIDDPEQWRARLVESGGAKQE